ncbi:MAG: hypothetical protein ACR2JO_07960 [Mycobacteriales bacterium]
MSRAEIMAEVVARLEAERMQSLPRRMAPAQCDPVPDLTPEQQAENLRTLMEATGGEADLWARRRL